MERRIQKGRFVCACLVVTVAATGTLLGADDRVADPSGGAAARPPLASSAAAVEELGRVGNEVARRRFCSPECLESLERLHTDFQPEQAVRVLLEQAHFARGDWQALIDLAEGESAASMTVPQRARVAAFFHRAGRFEEAADRLDQLLAERPNDSGLARQSGLVLFELGEYDRAVVRLKSALAHLSSADAAEAETVLGLIYFHRGETGAAREHLERALRSQPESVSALGALARVRAGEGDEAGARELLDHAAVLREELVARERKALLMSTRARMASDAWTDGRFEECERIVMEMLAEAGEEQQVGLYRYLGEVRHADGRTEAAEAAMRKAEQVAAQLEAEEKAGQ